MSSYYLDTSAVLKRYLSEAGSAWLRGWIQTAAGNVVIVSDLALVEGFSAFARLRRSGSITPTRHARLQAVFLWHFEREYLVIPMDGLILVQARLLVDHYPLRALDAIQLASAQHAATVLAESLTFVAGDQVLINAAAGEGFTTADPNTHP